MNNSFHELRVNINQLNRIMLDHINALLKEHNVYDLNANQTFLLSNIGNDAKNVQDANKLGYYIGTNISYNVGYLVKHGYIDRLDDNVDKRRAFLVLTDKGKQVLELIEGDNMSQENTLKKIGIDVNNMNEILVRLQRII